MVAGETTMATRPAADDGNEERLPLCQTTAPPPSVTNAAAAATTRPTTTHYGTHHLQLPGHPYEEDTGEEEDEICGNDQPTIILINHTDPTSGTATNKLATAAEITTPTSASPTKRWIGGIAYLVIFVLLYSANNAVLAGLMDKGYPYTICNIMCIGNVVGVLTLFPVFYTSITWKNIKKVTPLQWGWTLLGCLLANVLGSVAYLQGLRLTSVPARAMTGRLESVDFLLASACFLKDRHGAWVQFNGLLTVLGVVVAILYHHLLVLPQGTLTDTDTHTQNGDNKVLGYIYLVLGGWGYTLSLLITKKYLVQIPVGLLSLFKLSFGTILFHFLSVLQHGEANMALGMGLYTRQLWWTMLWYAPLFVTATQVLWLRALKLCSPSVLSIGMNANFVVTVAWGILLLGKWPTRGELLGGAFILVSIISGVIETCVNKDKDEKEITAAKALREAVEEGRKARRGRKKRKKEEKEREKEIAHTQPEAAMALLAKHTHTYTHTQTNPQEEEKGTVGAAPLHVVLVDEEAWGVKGGIDSEGVGVGVGGSSSSSSSDDGDGEEEGEEGGEQTLLLKKPHFSARVHIEQDNLTEGSGIYPFL